MAAVWEHLQRPVHAYLGQLIYIDSTSFMATFASPKGCLLAIRKLACLRRHNLTANCCQKVWIFFYMPFLDAPWRLTTLYLSCRMINRNSRNTGNFSFDVGYMAKILKGKREQILLTINTLWTSWKEAQSSILPWWLFFSPENSKST